jgi:hypothetical protein
LLSHAAAALRFRSPVPAPVLFTGLRHGSKPGRAKTPNQPAGGAAWFTRAGRAAAGCAGAVLLKNGGSVPPLKGLWVRLREKGGKRHAMPCHHNLDEYLVAYLDGAGLRDDPKGRCSARSGAAPRSSPARCCRRRTPMR